MTTSPPRQPPAGGSAAVGLLAAALTLAGLGLVLLAWDLPGQPLQRLGANQSINPGATDPADVATHNSPALARNPTDAENVVTAARIDGPDTGCAVYHSTDAGTTWQPTTLPLPEDGGDWACFAPDVAFGLDGRLYVAFVTLGGLRNEPTGAWIATSTDGGQTLSEPQRVTDGRPFQVSLAADPSEDGRVYLAWLEASAEPGPWGFAESGNPVRVARSTDAATSWSEPTTASAADHEEALAPNIAVNRDGEVTVAYLDLAGDRLDYHGEHDGQGGPAYDSHWTLALARSGDEAASWMQDTVTDELTPRRRLIAFFPPTPALAVHDDTTYVAFHDARRSPADVWLWTASDGDAFGEPTQVNDTGFGDQTSQYLPQLAVTEDGRLDVVYYDRRDDPDNVFTHTSLQVSPDGGETFTGRLRLSDEAFDSRIGDGAERNLADLGSQLALAATPSRATAAWADTRAATQASAQQDLAAAHAAVATTAPQWRPAAFAGGALLALAGLLLAARWLRHRRRSPHRPAPTPAGAPARR